MKLSAIRRNTAAVEQGRWVDDIPGMGDLRLRVRGSGNKDWNRLQSELFDKVPREQRLRGLSDEDGFRIDTECLLTTVLQDWGNLVGDGVIGDLDQPVAYAIETARRLLSEPEYIVIRNAVTWAAGVVAVDAEADQEDDAKNSETRSPGN